MTLSSAFANALTGLNVSARRADVVSANIANAKTPGYVRRQAELSAQVLGGQGGGVRVDAIRRDQDLVLLTDRRLAGASATGAGVTTAFLKQAEAAIGTPEQPGSLGARLASLDAALIAAAAQSGSEPRLANVLSALQGLTEGLSRATDTVQAARRSADARIAAEVGALNAALAGVDQLNDMIAAQDASDKDISALLDQRQKLIDGVSGIVPLRELPREQNRVALVTAGGAILLESGPVKLDFTPTALIVAESGPLGGLTMNGHPQPMGPGAPMAGGSLAALFQVRDDLAPAAQARLDALALDVAGRLASVDAAAGMGWLTDGGLSLDPAEAVGLAGRLAVNPGLDPAQGGALWRLRDGLAATVPGPPGNGGRLSAQAAALSDPRNPALAGVVVPGARSAAQLAADLLGQTSVARLSAEVESGYSSARSEALVKMELDRGVDTDAELQDLMQVEQAWAANARVIRTMDDLLQLLMEI